MTSVLNANSAEFKPASDAVESVMINLTVTNLYDTSYEVQYTFYIEPHITIGMFKEYLSPIFQYLPENMDILLSKSMPYPIADKMQISMLHEADMCELVMQPCGSPICSCIAYISVKDHKTTIDLQNLPFKEITSLPYWFQTTPIHSIILNADHPRIDEILYKLSSFIKPSNTLLENVTFIRSFPTHHLPLVTNEALVFFYHTLSDGMKNNNIKVYLDKNIVHNDNMLELGEWLRTKQ